MFNIIEDFNEKINAFIKIIIIIIIIVKKFKIICYILHYYYKLYIWGV